MNFWTDQTGFTNLPRFPLEPRKVQVTNNSSKIFWHKVGNIPYGFVTHDLHTNEILSYFLASIFQHHTMFWPRRFFRYVYVSIYMRYFEAQSINWLIREINVSEVVRSITIEYTSINLLQSLRNVIVWAIGRCMSFWLYGCALVRITRQKTWGPPSSSWILLILMNNRSKNGGAQ